MSLGIETKSTWSSFDGIRGRFSVMVWQEHKHLELLLSVWSSDKNFRTNTTLTTKMDYYASGNEIEKRLDDMCAAIDLLEGR